jgi:hypothetical protein
MYDISVLDKDKTYVGLSFSNNLVSDSIENLQKGCEGIIGEKCSHVLTLCYENYEWFIWEAHFDFKGVRKISLREYTKEKVREGKNRIIFKEFEMDLSVLNYYLHFKYYYPYSVINLACRLFDNIPLLKGRGTKNLICSKYVALANINYKLCYKFNIPYDEITPAHVQSYVQNLPIAYQIN